MGKVTRIPGGMSRAKNWISRSSLTSWILGRSYMSWGLDGRILYLGMPPVKHIDTTKYMLMKYATQNSDFRAVYAALIVPTINYWWLSFPFKMSRQAFKKLIMT
jgi:hypothetical protein